MSWTYITTATHTWPPYDEEVIYEIGGGIDRFLIGKFNGEITFRTSPKQGASAPILGICARGETSQREAIRWHPIPPVE